MSRDPFRGDTPLPPGSTIGIIGGGQLGRMTAIAARQLGYRTAVLDPDPNSPAAQVADRLVNALYHDRDAARDLARMSDVLTYEFENVDADAAEVAAEIQTLFPSSSVLRATQHRVREKDAIRRNGLPTAEYRAVQDAAGFRDALKAIGMPAVLKTATSGYDGKGQAVIQAAEEAQTAFERLMPMSSALVLEKFIPFRMEVSVVCARDASGKTLTFPVSENIHVNGILDTSIVPARVEPHIAQRAADLACAIAEALGVVGLIAVEMFVTQDGEVLINELAPRPHNSGHYTIDACRTSQFEQLVRVICGLPMGAVDMPKPAAMVNLLGEVWLDTEDNPDWPSALALPGVSLHLYGKSEARKGRKMGHITAVADTVEEAMSLAAAAREKAWRRGPPLSP